MKESTKLFIELLKKLKAAKQGMHKSNGSNRFSILEDVSKVNILVIIHMRHLTNFTIFIVRSI